MCGCPNRRKDIAEAPVEIVRKNHKDSTCPASALTSHWRDVPMSGLFGGTLVGSISMPMRMYEQVRLTNYVSNKCLAGFALRQVFVERRSPGLLLPISFARLWFRLEH